MRLLVTGGAGYIGSHTVRELVHLGHDVTVFDNLELGHPASVAVPIEQGELAAASRIEHVMAEGRFEGVLHLPAMRW